MIPEIIVKEKLVNFCDKFDKISSVQSGFKQNHSCENIGE